MKISDELKVVGSTFSVQLCLNGYVLEVSGRSHDDEWITVKYVAKDRAEFDSLISEVVKIPMEK